MGSPTSRSGSISHTVTLTNDYYVMTTEVTQAMFYEVMGYQSYDGLSSSTVQVMKYCLLCELAYGCRLCQSTTHRHNSVNGTNLQECYAFWIGNQRNL